MEILRKIQEHLTEKITTIQYIDEDSRHLDYYSPHPPVKWPCVLIDEDQGNFSDIGTHPRSKPKNRQQGRMMIKITVANLKLNNTSSRAPIKQKDNAWSIWKLINQIHTELQGAILVENGGRLLRRARERFRRDDGIQQYHIFYEIELSDV